MDWTWYLFRFDGRINRARFWLAIPVLFGLMMTAGLVIIAIHGLFGSAAPFYIGASDLFKLVDPDAYRTLTWADLPQHLIKLFGTSLVMWVWFAISIKRLHDRDKSGWWILLFWLGPGILGGWQTAAPDLGGGLILSLAATAIAIWAFVELGCLRGTPGPNRYGPDPLGNPALAPRAEIEPKST